jgi:hypothetical protein
LTVVAGPQMGNPRLKLAIPVLNLNPWTVAPGKSVVRNDGTPKRVWDYFRALSLLPEP